ncbi:TonB-dependent receptor [Candidatus Fermentibacterales bacterium]|nr:TonB-dependent receptor [Candidatus Fermentibacterales bacterium]
MLALNAALPCLASSVGTIAGVVRSGTGDPLVGAAVIVEGSPYGAFTDANGEFFILRLPPGEYTLTARMVGMHPVTLEGVSVISDQTTRIDMVLRETAVGHTVIEVVDQRSLILEDLPSTIHVLDRTEIETMPVAGLLDVVQKQAGISSQGGGIHVRGGRSGEVAFLLDGVSVRDPVTNAFATSIPLSAISEASVTTGGFSSEYGNAMSGIVKMVVREGGPDYSGELDFRGGGMTAFGAESEARNYSEPAENDSYRSNCLNGEASLGGPEPVTTFLLPALGLEIPGHMRFFGACEWVRSGFDLEDSRGYRDNNWQNLVSGCLNLTYDPDNLTGIGCIGRYAYRQSGWDEWAWSRYDQPAYIEGEPFLGGCTDYALPIRFEENWGVTARASRMIGGNSVLEALFDRSVFNRWRRIREAEGGYVGEGLTPAAWFAEYFAEERAADSLGFYHAGVHPEVWLESQSIVTTGRATLTSRLSSVLECRAGVEGSWYDIYDFSVYASGPGQTFVSNWSARPRSYAAYLHSSADFSGAMVLNTGLRLDVFDPNTSIVTPGEAGPGGVEVKYQLSPRVGITHPVSDRDVFFATYGHYFQMPSLNQMFFGTNYNLSGTASIVGNPDLEAVRTIAYEGGVRHRFTDVSTIALSAFHKQITGLVRTAPTSSEGSDYFFMYENDDSYATVQGIEIALLKLPGDLWSGSASYTFSVARGRYSSATEQYEYSVEGFSPIPDQESYLDWDQRHTANLHLLLSLDREEGPLLGGMRPLEGLSASLDWSWGSGFPFSPPATDTLPEINTERYPWTMQTDLGVSRRFWLGPVELEASLTVFNLFDRRNLTRIFDPAMYLQTGDPGGELSNPAAWSPARHLLFGLSVEY